MITRAALENATKARVKAVFAASNEAGAAAGTAPEKYTLPNEDLGFLTEMLNRENPLSVYTGVTISGQGSGTVEVKYDIYRDNWTAKDKLGSTPQDVDNVLIDDEVFKWNKPIKKEEGIGAFDMKRGVPNILTSRMNTASVKYLQNSIKAGFQTLIDHTAKADGAISATTTPNGQNSFAAIGALDFTTRDKIAEFKIKLIQEVTKFANASELDASEVVITLEPLTFDALAENGMIGDRATQTFAGGQYTVGTLGGYKVQSGGMYIPIAVSGQAAVTTGNVYAFVGSSRVALHTVDLVAANVGTMGNSNDLQTYLEVSDIFGAMNYVGKFGKSEGLVIGDATLA